MRNNAWLPRIRMATILLTIVLGIAFLLVVVTSYPSTPFAVILDEMQVELSDDIKKSDMEVVRAGIDPIHLIRLEAGDASIRALAAFFSPPAVDLKIGDYPEMIRDVAPSLPTWWRPRELGTHDKYNYVDDSRWIVMRVNKVKGVVYIEIYQ